MMSSFRRSAVLDTRPAPKNNGKKKFSGRIFYEKMKIPQNTPTPFILLKGDFESGDGQKVPYFKVRKHKRTVNIHGRDQYPDEVCSAGKDPYNPQPCAGCLAMERGDKSVTVGDVFLFSILHLVNYHGHPVLDRESGGWLTNSETGQQVTSYSECTGRTCNFCRVKKGEQPVTRPGETWGGYPADSITTVFGKRRYIEVGKNHLADLTNWDQEVSATCWTCNEELTLLAFLCSSCSAPVVDLNTDTRPMVEILDSMANKHNCKACGHTGYLVDSVTCKSCEASGKTSLRQALFDVVVTGMRQGESTNSHLVMRKPRTIEDFEKTIDTKLLDGKTLREFISQFTPHDFAEAMAPRSLEDQAKRLKLSEAGVQPPPRNNPREEAMNKQQSGGSRPFVPNKRPSVH